MGFSPLGPRYAQGLSANAVRAHPSVVAFYRLLDRDAKQAAAAEDASAAASSSAAVAAASGCARNGEGSNSTALHYSATFAAATAVAAATAASPSTRSAARPGDSSRDRGDGSSGSAANGRSSGRAAGWAPSRSPLQPWVCPGFGGGADGDGWIARPHGGRVAAAKTLAEDTWMDQVGRRVFVRMNTCFANRALCCHPLLIAADCC